jgi:hypothetical protein
MPVFTVARPLIAIGLNSSPTDCRVSVLYDVVDGDNNRSVGSGLEVVIASGDNALQVENKIRDAVIVDAAFYGFTVDTSNFFMPQLRRG